MIEKIAIGLRLAVTTSILLCWKNTLSAQQIDVETNVEEAGIKVKSLNSTSAAWLDFFNDQDKSFQMGITGSSNYFFGSNHTAYFFAGQGSDIPLVFATEGKERLRIVNNGNIGIGTILPKAGLNLQNKDVRIDTGSLKIDIGSVEVTTKWGDTAGEFILDNVNAHAHAIRAESNSKNAASLYVQNNGNGRAAEFNAQDDSAIFASASPSALNYTLSSQSTGLGGAGSFYIMNSNSVAPALVCSTTGSGDALFVSGSAFKTAGNPDWDIGSDRRLKKTSEHLMMDWMY